MSNLIAKNDNNSRISIPPTGEMTGPIEQKKDNRSHCHCKFLKHEPTTGIYISK